MVFPEPHTYGRNRRHKNTGAAALTPSCQEATPIPLLSTKRRALHSTPLRQADPQALRQRLFAWPLLPRSPPGSGSLCPGLPQTPLFPNRGPGHPVWLLRQPVPTLTTALHCIYLLVCHQHQTIPSHLPPGPKVVPGTQEVLKRRFVGLK